MFSGGFGSSVKQDMQWNGKSSASSPSPPAVVIGGSLGGGRFPERDSTCGMASFGESPCVQIARSGVGNADQVPILVPVRRGRD